MPDGGEEGGRRTSPSHATCLAQAGQESRWGGGGGLVNPDQGEEGERARAPLPFAAQSRQRAGQSPACSRSRGRGQLLTSCSVQRKIRVQRPVQQPMVAAPRCRQRRRPFLRLLPPPGLRAALTASGQNPLPPSPRASARVPLFEARRGRSPPPQSRSRRVVRRAAYPAPACAPPLRGRLGLAVGVWLGERCACLRALGRARVCEWDL